ncbi:hypothetical protein GCM10009735_38970 [Actinomadura chokoriensis]
MLSLDLRACHRLTRYRDTKSEVLPCGSVAFRIRTLAVRTVRSVYVAGVGLAVVAVAPGASYFVLLLLFLEPLVSRF